ncbi:MAG: DNA cytosine methyltransferase [Spirochaetes bacterium]|nr:DNA cytosine methyltransferase [Spirochaetota bacterium]
MIHSICVFCGSSSGFSLRYSKAAASLGREIASRGLALVYGGGNFGTMGSLAKAAMAAGGRVTGIIPKKRNTLVERFLFAVATLKPTWFLFENVVGLLTHRDGSMLASLLRGFEDIGYKVSWRVINAALYGVPQSVMKTEGFLDEAILADLCVADSPAGILSLLEAKASSDSPPPSKLPELTPEV